MRHRLKDVAARAGVSVKTVSNVVNGYVHVRAAHPRPGPARRSTARLPAQPRRPAPARGAHRRIALAVPELDVAVLRRAGRRVIDRRRRSTAGRCYRPDRRRRASAERLVADGIRDHLIDGLIFSPLALSAEDLRRPRPATADGAARRARPRRAGATTSSIDNVAAAREATEHLIELGRRRIAAIGAQARPAAQTAQLRARGLPRGAGRGRPAVRRRRWSRPADG